MIEVLLIQVIAFVSANGFIQNSYANSLQRSLSRSLRRTILYILISLLSNINESYALYSIVGSVAIFVGTILFEHRVHKKIGKFTLLMAGQLLIILAAFSIKFELLTTIINYSHLKNVVLDDVILKYILAFIICLTPSNIAIQALLNYLGIRGNAGRSLPKGGRFMGSVERIIALTLVIHNQYEAIGLLVAAKSILRTADNQAKSEYIIIGNLLSFGIAIGTGIVLLWSLS